MSAIANRGQSLWSVTALCSLLLSTPIPAPMTHWHWSNSVRQGLCNGSVSVHLSVCLSHLSTSACRYSGFAAVGPTCRWYRSIAAAAGRRLARRTAANASSVTLSADEESLAQTCLQFSYFYSVRLFLCLCLLTYLQACWLLSSAQLVAMLRANQYICCVH